MNIRCEILESSDMMQPFLRGVIGATQRYGLGGGGFIIHERRLVIQCLLASTPQVEGSTSRAFACMIFLCSVRASSKLRTLSLTLALTDLLTE